MFAIGISGMLVVPAIGVAPTPPPENPAAIGLVAGAATADQLGGTDNGPIETACPNPAVTAAPFPPKLAAEPSAPVDETRPPVRAGPAAVSAFPAAPVVVLSDFSMLIIDSARIGIIDMIDTGYRYDFSESSHAGSVDVEDVDGVGAARLCSAWGVEVVSCDSTAWVSVPAEVPAPAAA